MPRVIVDVMPKPEILDPQGQAIARALPDLGFDGVTSVRQGKRFEIEVADGGDPLEIARRAAEAMLANPVIEDYAVHLAG
jgi:phosphoribosylformylglycinamidine synthase